MNDRIQIKGLGKLDGEYEVDPAAFDNRDLHTIKVIAGVRAGELDEAWSNQDNDLIVAFAAIGLRKSGVAVDKDAVDTLWDAPLGAITFLAGDEQEEDAGPPSQTPREPGETSDENAKPASSGDALSNGGDHHQSDPSPTGSPDSGTGARFAPPTSVS